MRGDGNSQKQINAITAKISGCVYQIGNTLGCAFLKNVDAKAMAIALRPALRVEQECPIKVRDEDIVVGDWVSDLFGEHKNVGPETQRRTVREPPPREIIGYGQIINAINLMPSVILRGRF